MDFVEPVRRFDRFQQRHKSLALPFAVIRKFSNDQASNLAALVAYYAFFSLVPLLLVFLTILGYVLQHNQGTLHSVENSITTNYPALGKVISFRSLKGHVIAIVVGLATSLWSGLGVTNAIQNALDRVWAVPFKHRPNFLTSRLRGLAALALIGILFILATAASGLVAGGLGGPVAKVLGLLVSLGVNMLLFLVAFRLLTARTVPTRDLRFGIVVAAVFWTILQALGGLYVGHLDKKLAADYQTVSFVIALLVFLHLGAQLTLYAAELNTVVTRKLWPRSLMGPPVQEADRETLTALAKVEERHDAEEVEVSFDPQQTGEIPVVHEGTGTGGSGEQLRTGDPPTDA